MASSIVPQTNLGALLSQFGDDVRQRNLSRTLGPRLQAGDYQGAAGAAFEAGDASTGLGLLKLGETFRQNRQEEANALQVGALLGGQSGATPTAAGPEPLSAPPTFVNASGANPSAARKISGNSADFINAMLPHAIEASKATGVDPRLIIAQSAIETGYGRHAPGNNYFGVKSHGQGGGNQLATTEVVNGQPTRVTDSFRAYPSMADSAAGYADFINGNPRYASLKSAQGIEAQAAELQRSGYATDPAYGQKVLSVARSIQVPGETGGEAPASAALSRGIMSLPPEQRVSRLLSLSTKRLPENVAGTVKALLENALQESKLPDEVKSFVWARSQGLTQAANPKAYARESSADGGAIRVRPGDTLVDPSTMVPMLSIPDRDKSAEGEAKLRGEFSAQTKAFADVQDAYGRVVASVQGRADDPSAVSPAADIALVFGFMKMLDPGSVVREGEYATAKNAAGIPDRIQSTYNKLLSGEFLTPAQRDDFVRQAGQVYGEARKTVEGTAERYRGLARASGFDEGRVVALPKAPEPPARRQPAPPSATTTQQRGAAGSAPQQQPAQVPANGATATNPRTGEKLMFNGRDWAPFT